MRVHPTVTASTIITQFEGGHKVRCHTDRVWKMSWRVGRNARRGTCRPRYLHDHRLASPGRQIIPSRIRSPNQCRLLLPPPLFDLSLARNGVAHILKTVVVNQPMYAILSRERSAFADPVPQDPRH